MVYYTIMSYNYRYENSNKNHNHKSVICEPAKGQCEGGKLLLKIRGEGILFLRNI